MTPRPLEMNPPTPPIASSPSRPLRPVSGNDRPHLHARGDSFGVVGDKARYYGTLHAGGGKGMGVSGYGGAKADGEKGGGRVDGARAPKGEGSRVLSSGSRFGAGWGGGGGGGGMRVRGVSGKVAEEGRANCQF